MENNFDNTSDNNDMPKDAYSDPNAGTDAGQSYTDPNAGQQYYGNANQNQQYNYQQYQNGTGQQGGYNYQDNYNYNVGNNTGYNRTYDTGMDTSPMSLGDWVLTILALCIPCAGIVLYFVWAFGKNGNVNRRNYCRASLIITGVVVVIYIIFMVIFGVAAFSSVGYY